jgi:hypothetical protein
MEYSYGYLIDSYIYVCCPKLTGFPPSGSSKVETLRTINKLLLLKLPALQEKLVNSPPMASVDEHEAAWCLLSR